MLEGFIILETLGDPIIKMLDGKNINLLKQILAKVCLRIETLEIEMGMLVMRKKADGYEWLIEI